MNTKAYASHAPNQPLSLFQFNRRELRDDDVEFEVLYCGVCHSDLHHITGDWRTTYPCVPGHEIVGRVSKIGKHVTQFKIGDAVAMGCMVDSCQRCRPCLNQLEQYCEEGATFTYNDTDRQDKQPTFGGYSEHMVVREKFALHVPNHLDLAAAAPLLCAGITVYSPLKHWKVQAGSKVGIIGLGGLGHMAIKLARAMGAEVTLFSRSPDKEEDARRLGAHHIVLSSDKAQMKAVANTLDVIIDTAPYTHDLQPYLQTLTLDGSLVLVGLIDKIEPSFNSASLVLGRRSVAGSLIGSIAETQEMLNFCGHHNIVSDIELIPIQEINHAYKRMLKSDVKYRFVIDMSSLKQ